MLGLQPPPLQIRAAGPRFPTLKLTLLVGLLATGALALLPQMSVSAPATAPRGTLSELGTPVAQLLSERQGEWQNPAADYIPLPRRSAELNALLSSAVNVLTAGTAVASRDRLFALQGALQQDLHDVQRLRVEAALTPANPCTQVRGDVLGAVNRLTCRFETNRAERAALAKDAEGTVAQRLQQIAAERERFSADLKSIGIEVTPTQVDGLLSLATAHDLVNLHAAYSNLKEITGQLRAAMLKAGHSPATAQRYYGLYVVLLEVALHMHEEFFVKLHGTYLPRLDAIANATEQTYDRAIVLAKATGRADLRTQLAGNIDALELTRRAAKLYRTTLLSQARAVNESWQRLYEQHEVAVNSYRTVNLSGALLGEMGDNGSGFDTLRQLDVPALENLGNAALEREFERLSRALTNPNG